MNYYRSCSRSDGFGAQLQNIIIDLLVTEHAGNKYVFPDIKGMEHNYDDNPQFISNIIEYINLKPYYICQNIHTDVHSYSTTTQNYAYFEDNIDKYLTSNEYHKMIQYFYMNKINPFNTNVTNVSVHIRRPNSHDSRLEGADTPDSYYLNVIDRIRNTYKDTPLKIHIYSQGNNENFTMYQHDDTVLHLNEPLIDTFNGLIFGNILVTSASSLSYVAALLSKGIVYYKPFWHKPASKWIVC
jgi:hypothetical protein